MNIYPSKNNPVGFYVYAYVRCADSETAKAGTPYYIGKGTRRRAWDKNHAVKLPPDLNNIIILYEGLTEDEALAKEKDLISLFGKVMDGTGILRNITNGGVGVSGITAVIDPVTGHTSGVSIHDPRISSRELIPVCTGKLVAKDKDGNIFHISTNDPRLESGELCHIYSGMMNVKDKMGNTFKVAIDHPNVINGTWVSVMEGLSLYTEISSGKNVFLTPDDPRIGSEFTSINDGFVIVKDKDGNVLRVKTDDPLYLDGTYVHERVGNIALRMPNGEAKSISYSDPLYQLYLNGELLSINVNMANMLNVATQESVTCHVDDIRIISGELVGHTKKHVKALHVASGTEIETPPKDRRFVTGELIFIPVPPPPRRIRPNKRSIHRNKSINK